MMDTTILPKNPEIVFISDLHLHPEDADIEARFNTFIAWATKATKTVYILGDFLHAWPGDDALCPWSCNIALKIASLKEAGIDVFYMHGNRDFLVGNTFAKLAKWTHLSEPAVIQCGKDKVLLVHGDRYCTKDVMHQWFRFLTRNALFCAIFKQLPLRLRSKMVYAVRNHSQNKPVVSWENLDVVTGAWVTHLQKLGVQVLVHGHTHKPGLETIVEKGQNLRRYVLSDWDDSPALLCYDKSQGFYYVHLDAVMGELECLKI
jgi:UDP-2,3-diacylglucosamine hydrolase